MNMCCGAADVFTGAQTLFAEASQDAGFEVASVVEGSALPLDGRYKNPEEGEYFKSIHPTLKCSNHVKFYKLGDTLNFKIFISETPLSVTF